MRGVANEEATSSRNSGGGIVGRLVRGLPGGLFKSR